jgi:hypothetical protein
MPRNRYEQLIERIFLAHYKRGSAQITFDRQEIPAMANRLGIEIPKNLGDLIYSFRYRVALPTSITSKAPKGKEWDHPTRWAQQISIRSSKKVGNRAQSSALANQSARWNPRNDRQICT